MVGKCFDNGWPIVGEWLAMVCKWLSNGWPMVGQWFADCWPVAGQCLTNGWQMNGWPTVGQLLANGWSMVEQWLANGCPMVVKCVCLFGVCLFHFLVFSFVTLFSVNCWQWKNLAKTKLAKPKADGGKKKRNQLVEPKLWQNVLDLSLKLLCCWRSHPTITSASQPFNGLPAAT